MEIKLRKISENIYEIPKEDNMNVPVRIYASDNLIEKMKQDKTLIQGRNVAILPGIQKYAVIMPDGHEGYGFPVGGVAAFDINEGIISPGGIGYDINCGVRLLRTNLKYEEIKPKLKQIVDEIFRNVPAGVGETGKILLSPGQFREAVEEGLDWSYREGYAWKEDLNHVESYGRLKDASIEYVSDLAIRRGIDQLGTLGSGNHFLEIQVVDKIFDPEIAKIMGIEEEGQVTILIHTGSRGFGHQIASDYIDLGMKKYRDIINKLPDRELVYLPFQSEDGQRYWKSMSAAANFAWNNRQIITYWVRKSFEKVYNHPAEDIGLNVIYDVAHNIAKIEEHKIDGKKKKVIVHRKGATRAFPSGSEELVEEYRKIGQPVLIPGSMGTASYVLLGLDGSMELSFGSSAHGAGRNLSRAAARRQFNYGNIIRNLEEKGILVKSTTKEGVVEEVPEAYKNVDEVAKVTQDLGISKIIVRLRPIAVIKG
jgi:tRNA-splicing ligase RtcB